MALQCLANKLVKHYTGNSIELKTCTFHVPNASKKLFFAMREHHTNTHPDIQQKTGVLSQKKEKEHKAKFNSVSVFTNFTLLIYIDRIDIIK